MGISFPFRPFLGFVLVSGLIASGAAIAQNHPQGYFRNPLAIPISLAGNFGECRPGHFHMGLDLKTEGRENLPVFAAADGYVSRVKLEPGGFGRAIYLTHPNGYTTLYAHLNDFYPALQRYVRRLQYENESWTLDQPLMPDQFPVKKGQQIAWSGNTGGSTAPHLHFEIRDTETERALNPQLFGFDIRDSRPPLPTDIVLYDLSGSKYRAGKPLIKTLRKAADVYTLAEAVTTAPDKLVGIGVVVNDFMDGSTNTLAFHTAELYLDDALQTTVSFDDIGYDETRYLHAYADYPTKQRGGPWVQCLFQLPGNNLDRIFLHSGKQKGALVLTSTDHAVRIVLRDRSGNSSTVSFRLRAPEADATPGCSAAEILFDANSPAEFEHPNIRFATAKNALYDALCFSLKWQDAGARSFSEKFSLADPTIPVHSFFDLAIKPTRPVPFALRSKLALMYSDGKKTSGKGTVQESGGWYKASVRAFGDYWLQADTTAPFVKPAGSVAGSLKGKRSMAFTATDATTSVKSFRGEIDGQWVLFEQHGNKWTYVFDEHCPPGKHNLIVRATDDLGNETRKTYSFVR